MSQGQNHPKTTRILINLKLYNPDNGARQPQKKSFYTVTAITQPNAHNTPRDRKISPTLSHSSKINPEKRNATEMSVPPGALTP